MITLHSVIYDSTDEGGIIIAHCYEFNQLGTGKDTREAMGDLEKAIQTIIDDARGDPNTKLMNPAAVLDPAMERIARDPSLKPIVVNIEGYAILNHYDLTGGKFTPDYGSEQ